MSENIKTKKKFELASQEKQKKVAAIQDIFLKQVLDIDGALVTDESKISDFLSDSIDKAVGPGKEPGTMKFAWKKYIGPRGTLSSYRKTAHDPTIWQDVEFETEPGMGRKDVIVKTIEVFGVDISSVYATYLVDVLLFIVENYRPKGERD